MIQPSTQRTAPIAAATPFAEHSDAALEHAVAKARTAVRVTRAEYDREVLRFANSLTHLMCRTIESQFPDAAHVRFTRRGMEGQPYGATLTAECILDTYGLWLGALTEDSPVHQWAAELSANLPACDVWLNVQTREWRPDRAIPEHL